MLRMVSNEHSEGVNIADTMLTGPWGDNNKWKLPSKAQQPHVRTTIVYCDECYKRSEQSGFLRRPRRKSSRVNIVTAHKKGRAFYTAATVESGQRRGKKARREARFPAHSW